MKGKFTPLNKTHAIELAKKYNLIQGCFGAEYGMFGDYCDENEFRSVISFGIDINSANNNPLIDIMENGKSEILIILYETPYIASNWNEDGSRHSYYIEPNSCHFVSSVERFEKYLKIGIENYKNITQEVKELNFALQNH